MKHVLKIVAVATTLVWMSKWTEAQEPLKVQVSNMKRMSVDGEIAQDSIVKSAVQPKMPRVPSIDDMTGPMKPALETLHKAGNAKNAEPKSEIFSATGDRGWNRQCSAWVAPNFFCHPLYFEQVNLERYDSKLHPCAVSLVSYGRFLGDLHALPVRVALDLPTTRQYTLGHLRPADILSK